MNTRGRLAWLLFYGQGLSAPVVSVQEDDLAHYGHSLRRRGPPRRPLQSGADLPGSSLRATAGSISPRTQSLKPFQVRP